MKIKELREKLIEEDLDAFLARENARYLAETPAVGVVIITTDTSILLCSRLDFDRARRESEIEEIRVFSKEETPLRETEKVTFGEFGKVIGEILKELGVNRIGYDRLKGTLLEKIRKEYEAEYREESNLIWNLRKIKTPKEIKFLKKSAKIACQGIEKAAELIEPGRTELEIVAEIEYEMRKMGSEGTPFDTILAAGENSWLPHTEATSRKLEEGELVTIDLGAKWKGYCSDMTRTFSLSPTPQQEKILKITKEAQEAALEKIMAGVGAKEIDAVARDVFKDVGYEKFYLHGLGHGVGLDIHEPPSLSPSSEDTLEKNMIITVEPGIYVQEIGGCRFEDMILVKEEGWERLT